MQYKRKGVISCQLAVTVVASFLAEMVSGFMFKVALASPAGSGPT